MDGTTVILFLAIIIFYAGLAIGFWAGRRWEQLEAEMKDIDATMDRIERKIRDKVDPPWRG